MTTRTMSGAQRFLMLALLVALTAPGGVFAEGRYGESNEHRGFDHQHVDTRFSHNHSYFDRGYSFHEQPHGGYAIDRGRDHFWYDRGQWYRRSGVNWVVVGAPIGAFVTVLPPFYTSVWLGGVPYYYANDTYYTWSGDRNEYEVVAPPDGIDSSGTTQPPGSDAIFVYPKNGQSSEQQARDQYDCHHSAVEQTGYDPTQAGGGVTSEVAASKRTDYFRADAACLDARGHSVR